MLSRGADEDGPVEIVAGVVEQDSAERRDKNKS